MPVYGTPQPTPDVSSNEGIDAPKLRPGITEVNGRQVLAKMQSVVAASGQKAIIDWTFRDRNGDPLDLTTLGLPPGNPIGTFGGAGDTDSSSSALVDFPTPEEDAPAYILLRLQESIVLSGQQERWEAEATVVDAPTGRISVEVPANALKLPGILVGEFAILNSSDEVLITNRFWFIVERSLFGEDPGQILGPPSLAEIRLHLRDNGPEDNLLLDTVDFDMSEIAASIMRPLHYFNEALPPLSKNYDTTNFPYRWHWLEAICANLFSLAAEHYRRNFLPYSAGGVNLDDKNKYNQYMQASQLREQNWKEWVLRKKAQLNAEGAFSSFESSYSDTWW